MDTLPKQGGGGGGQTREEAVDALCGELLGKVGRAGGSGRKSEGVHRCWEGGVEQADKEASRGL